MTIVPNLGRILPELGIARTWSKGVGLAGALFTPVQQRVLGLLFGQPQRRSDHAGSDLDLFIVSEDLAYTPYNGRYGREAC